MGSVPFIFGAFQGQSDLFHPDKARLPCAWINWKILCKTSRRNCQQNPHNWKRVKHGKKGYKNTRLPKEPITLISESLKPTCRHSDEPARKPIQCQREPKLSVCWRKRCSEFWHVGPPGTSQISRVPVSFLPKELPEQNYQSSLFWNYFSIWVKVDLFALVFLLLSFQSINKPSCMQLWQRITGQVYCNNSAIRRENKLDLIYFRRALCIDVFFD